MENDVIIIGAGPAGLSMACSLSKLGLSVTVIEKQTEVTLANPAYDGREIALTHFSKHMLEMMGAWQRIPDQEIGLVKEAKVLDGNSSYALHFDYRQVCDDTLGYMISNHQIRKALYQEVKARDNVTLLSDCSVDMVHTSNAGGTVTLLDGSVYEAPLIIAADSRFSTSRRNMGISTKMLDFGKLAIICKVKHELPHDNVAYECFHYGGTLAMLPLSKGESSVVITVSADKGTEILAESDGRFCANVAKQFNERYGKMELISKRFSYPLVATYADKFMTKRYAVIGDAAVGMHPVTAHGFNLGLKSQNILTNQIKTAIATGADIGSSKVLAGYDMKYRRASKPLYELTNAMVKLYTDDRPLPRLMRQAILRLGNHVTPVRKVIMNQLTEVNH